MIGFINRKAFKIYKQNYYKQDVQIKLKYSNLFYHRQSYSLSLKLKFLILSYNLIKKNFWQVFSNIKILIQIENLIEVQFIFDQIYCFIITSIYQIYPIIFLFVLINLTKLAQAFQLESQQYFHIGNKNILLNQQSEI